MRASILIDTAIQAQMVVDDDRIVIYDAARMPTPPAPWFTPEHWPQRSVLDRGRGAAFAMQTELGEMVLRHYRRGGAVARVLKDCYVWTGAAQTRPICEFRLLAAALHCGLPVPRPMAAQVRRHGALYSGDLLMMRIADTQTLSARLTGLADWTTLDWQRIGAALGLAHAQGFEHADLNAHNVLIDAHEAVWLIDWDRGRQRAPGSWSEVVLARLARSLRKLYGARVDQNDARKGWQALLQAHAQRVKDV